MKVAQLPPHLMAKIELDAETDCWLWMGSRSQGYGRIARALSHRVIYELLVGPVPEGLELDHLCRVPACCNPAHLEPVTHKENMRRGKNTAPTHCPHGHVYDEANTARSKHGWIYCRACARRRALKYRKPPRPRKLKTHCVNGHELTPDNVAIIPGNVRRCKICHRERNGRSYHRLHDKAVPSARVPDL